MGIADFFRGRGVVDNQSKPQIVIQSSDLEKKEEKPSGPDINGWFKPAETDYKIPKFDSSKLFDLSPEKMQEFQQTLGQTNFMQNITNEQLQAIQAGGEDATKTLLQIVNSVGQQSLGAAIQANMQMVQGALAKASETVDTRVEHVTRDQKFTQAIRSANPALQKESSAFIVDSLKNALMSKQPNATEAEIKDMVSTYLTDLTTSATPQIPEDGNAQAGKQTDDWGAWVDPEVESRHQ